MNMKNFNFFNESYQKWYGDENDFHYNLTTGLVIGVGIYFILVLFVYKMYGFFSFNINLFIFNIMFIVFFNVIKLFNNSYKDVSLKKNVVLSQKKFYSDNGELKEQIYIKSNLKEQLLKENFLLRARKKIGSNDIINSIKKFKDFEGFVTLHSVEIKPELTVKDNKIFNVAFFNLLNREIIKYKVSPIEDDYGTVMFILKNFVYEDKSLELNINEWFSWKNELEKTFFFGESIKDDNGYLKPKYYDIKDLNVEYLKFKDINELMKYIKNI